MARKKKGFKKGYMSSVLIEPLLRLCAARPTGLISDSKLLAALTAIFKQGDDPKFAQIVQEMTSDEDSYNNVVSAGYVERVGDGVKITELGRKHIAELGETDMLRIMRAAGKAT